MLYHILPRKITDNKTCTHSKIHLRNHQKNSERTFIKSFTILFKNIYLYKYLAQASCGSIPFLIFNASSMETSAIMDCGSIIL